MSLFLIVPGVRPSLTGRPYRRLRALILKERPICEVCNRAPAVQVHHRTPLWMGGDRDNIDNLLAVCHPCHVAEQRRTPRPRVRY